MRRQLHDVLQNETLSAYIDFFITELIFVYAKTGSSVFQYFAFISEETYIRIKENYINR